MISLTLFSVTNEQSLIIATFIPIVIAVLAWVFPFPAIDSPKQESGNDNEEQQSAKTQFPIDYSHLCFRYLFSYLGYANL